MTCRKVRFNTLATAERVRADLEANKGRSRLESFLCDKCGGYHHGHSGKSGGAKFLNILKAIKQWFWAREGSDWCGCNFCREPRPRPRKSEYRRE